MQTNILNSQVMSSESLKSYLREGFESLKKSSFILESITESGNYGIALLTPDLRVVEVNNKMLEWFPNIDVEASPLCYQSFSCHSGPCPECPAVFTIREGKKSQAQIRYQSDKGLASFNISSSPLKGPEGESAGVLLLVEDVTEKIKKEKAFLELETKYRQIIENARDAIISFNRQGEISQANKRTQYMFGYTPEELQGKSIYSLIPEKLRDSQREMVKQIFDGWKGAELDKVLEGVFLRNDGTGIPTEMTLSLQKTFPAETVTLIIRDISERKNYESKLKAYAEGLEQEVNARTKQLAHSEQRYHALVETANDAIISTDQEGKIIYFNRKAEEMYQYARDEIIGKNISEIAPEDTLEVAQLLLKDSHGTAQGKTIESYGIKKDKTSHPVEFTISAFERDGEANLTLIARDITSRKRLELELHDYTAKLEEKVRGRTYELTASQQTLKEKVAELSILKEISEALSSAMDLQSVLNIILVGATSHYGLGFNRAFLFLVSEDGAFLEGQVAIGPSDSTEAQKIWSEILGKNLTLKEMLQSYIDKTGRVDTHVNDIVRSIRIPLKDENDILIKAIKKKESYNITNAFSNPLVPRSLITLMNCNAFALVPLIAHENVLGVLWADNAITKKTIDQADSERLRAFAINASLAIEKSNLYENIREKVIELDNANKELKESRDRLIRSEKLAAVGEMSATVAHGIRNPLVAIGGFARRLLKEEKGDGTSRKYLQIIVEEIDRLETILSELLDFVRPKRLNLKDEYLPEILEHALQVFYLELAKRNIKVEKWYQPDLPKLEIDAHQIKRVLHNLFNNAMEAMPDGGVLETKLTMEDSWVTISIADTGTGISEDNAEKVFHPFFTSKPTGTGLGLAVCNQIISIHGGHIKLRMQIPSGVIFDIYLPVTKRE